MNILKELKNILLGKVFTGCSDLSLKDDGTIDAEYYDMINIAKPVLGLVIKDVKIVSKENDVFLKLTFEDDTSLELYYDSEISFK